MSDTETLPAVQQTEGGNVELTAIIPEEFTLCQNALIDWCNRKIALMKREQAESEENLEHAIKNKWRSGPFKRAADLFRKRAEFYSKMLSALEAGYTIIPNMPLQLFAVRTDKKSVPWNLVGYQSQIPDVEAKALSEGEGRWVNPAPFVKKIINDDGKGNAVAKWTADSINEEIDFPVIMAKPQIMSATSRAMALNIFDEFGILPDNSRAKGDPMILARMIDPRPAFYAHERKRITFLIGWHLDTRTL